MQNKVKVTCKNSIQRNRSNWLQQHVDTAIHYKSHANMLINISNLLVKMPQKHFPKSRDAD